MGKKQVFRVRREKRMDHDIIALRREASEGEPLLVPVMKSGKINRTGGNLEEIRLRLQRDLEDLGGGCQAMEAPVEFPVKLAPGLERLQRKTLQEVREKELGES